jgi:hypothetical protein
MDRVDVGPGHEPGGRMRTKSEHVRGVCAVWHGIMRVHFDGELRDPRASEETKMRGRKEGKQRRRLARGSERA